MIGSNPQRGFTLLIAVILASVATAVGLSLSSLAFKSIRLSDTAQSSSSAFYAADTGLECALYADQQQNIFDYLAHATTPATSCASPGSAPTLYFTTGSSGSTLTFTSQSPSGYSSGWFPVGSGCARITVFKGPSGATKLYAEGLNICNTADPRVVQRGIYSYY